MLKTKFKELVQNKKELTQSSFEVLIEKQLIQLLGGCKSLVKCEYFSSDSCNSLQSCGIYRDTTVQEIN
jgi:hypothetical protein